MGEFYLKKCKELERIGTLKEYPKGSVIITEGSTGHNIYFILEGSVDVVLYTEEGKRVLLSVLTEGNFFGEMSVLENLPRSANIEARTQCRILEVSKPSFLRVIQSHPECALAIMTELCKRLREADEKIRILSLNSATERVKKYIELLWAKSRQAGIPFELPPKTRIAEEIGLSRETVTRIIKKLQEEGWLKKFLGS